ncbi:ABC transporter ATP-binding protein [Kribbella monticola]|uniref:ABC transporter ATP-binding protein n=1 Tax=Kribbella monticola TaxID=2185285 RepID=UPI0018E5742A|nr:ABC transporter ATP-binding protein [Kribbella monticola]
MSRFAATRSAVLLTWQAAPHLVIGRALVMVVQGVAPLAAAWCTKYTLDRLTGPDPTVALVAPPVLLLALSALLVGVLSPVDNYLGNELGRRAGLVARRRLFDAVAGLQGLRRFEDPEFLNRLRVADSPGSSTPCQLLSELLSLGKALVVVSGFVTSMLTLSPLVTGVVVLAAVPAVLAQLAMSRRRAALLWNTSPLERREIFYSSLLTQIQAAKEIRLFGLAGFLGDRMLAERRSADVLRRGVDRRDFATQTGLALLAALVSGAGLVWAAFTAVGGSLTAGDLTMVVAAVAALQSGIGGAVMAVAELNHDLLVFEHFREVERTEPDLVEPARPSALPVLRHAIEFRDVWFRYGEDLPWVLAGVNLTIPAGSAVGLVGHNGAGKSTLVKLLCRLYDPTRGAILWDGVDLRDVPVAELRLRIGAVFQDFMCYDLTAAENIGLGDLSAITDLKRIEAAGRNAGVDAAIRSLGKGYRTLLSRNFADEAVEADESDEDDEAGEGPGSTAFLSGGQWQKLATARAMLREDRDLMILDEPSSGLDADAEHDLHNRLRSLRRGRTSVLISHRLGALREADLIITLSEGRVIEQGSHHALLARSGVYAGLFRKQASGYQLEELAQ